MRRLLVSVGMIAVVGTANAQSSVTLYGILDEGINYVSNAGGGRLYNLSSSILFGSRWGLRGKEDLGGGLKAIFVLENGFDVNTGALMQKNRNSTEGLMFGRQAYVGISSPYGTVSAGRQYTPMVQYLGPLEVGAQWGGYITVHAGDIDDFNTVYRANNAITYTSPDIKGFSFEALYSLGGVAGDVSRNQIWSLAGGYTRGPLTLAAGYVNARNPNIGFFGNNGASSPVTASSNYILTPIYAGYASAHSYQVAAAGFAYGIGQATIGATYSNIRFNSLGDTVNSGPNENGYSGNAVFNDVEVNFRYQVTPALVLGAAANFTKGSSVASRTGTNPGAKYYQEEVGADYSLSKRTDVYLIGVMQQAMGTDSTGAKAVAAIASLSPSTSNRQATVRVGITHRF